MKKYEDYFWDVFNLMAEENSDGDADTIYDWHFAAPRFISALKTDEYRCLDNVNKAEALALVGDPVHAAEFANTWYVKVNANYGELCDAHMAGNKAAFNALL